MNAGSSTTAADRGAGLAEYSVLLILIVMVCIFVLTTLGSTINAMLAQAANIF